MIVFHLLYILLLISFFKTSTISPGFLDSEYVILLVKNFFIFKNKFPNKQYNYLVR